MDLLVTRAHQPPVADEFGLEWIVADPPPIKILRHFFRVQAVDICSREDRKILAPIAKLEAQKAAKRRTKNAANSRIKRV